MADITKPSFLDLVRRIEALEQTCSENTAGFHMLESHGCILDDCRKQQGKRITALEQDAQIEANIVKAPWRDRALAAESRIRKQAERIDMGEALLEDAKARIRRLESRQSAPPPAPPAERPPDPWTPGMFNCADYRTRLEMCVRANGDSLNAWAQERAVADLREKLAALEAERALWSRDEFAPAEGELMKRIAKLESALASSRKQAEGKYTENECIDAVLRWRDDEYDTSDDNIRVLRENYLRRPAAASGAGEGGR